MLRKYRKPGSRLMKSERMVQILLGVFIVILAVEVLFPLFLLVFNSFKLDTTNPIDWPKEGFSVEGYVLIWEYIKGNYLNSLIVAFSVSLGVTLVGSLAGYAFAHFSFLGKNILFIGILSFMMVPGLLTLTARYKLVLALGLNNNLLGVILPQIATSLPFAIFLTKTFFQNLPKQMFEAARMDGLSEAKQFYKLVLPLSQPIITTILIQTFVGQWNDYLWSRLVLQDEALQTLPVALVSLTESLGEFSYCAPFAGYVLSAIPLILIFLFGNKKFIAGMTSGAFKM